MIVFLEEQLFGVTDWERLDIDVGDVGHIFKRFDVS